MIIDGSRENESRQLGAAGSTDFLKERSREHPIFRKGSIISFIVIRSREYDFRRLFGKNSKFSCLASLGIVSTKRSHISGCGKNIVKY